MEQELMEPKTPLEITSDLTTIGFLISEMVAALNSGPKSRERSLVVTKLEEAGMWAVQGMAKE